MIKLEKDASNALNMNNKVTTTNNDIIKIVESITNSILTEFNI